MSLRPQAGGSVAGYRIERLLGRGGMGAVYLARDERLGRRVALKVLPSELADDERFRERFLREWRIAAALEHPHVVPITTRARRTASSTSPCASSRGPTSRS